ncbi:REP-associated tyrosine transposase [Alloalcanivorax xenomutans]|uniref:REP-associated tyrosine transposase n=1 Tax=Alloalcanivorax xenomutans TaxID=1094342 RepID=UPI0024E2634B|nr:transposase [Alloalcanivorax xenomutans]
MARPLRLEFAGALYHVTSRGNRRDLIYETDEDRHAFLAVLDDVDETFNWVCHAYCLMGNHYHLLVETPDGNLSKGMRHLNGVYTQIFNRHHRRVGHVFQGRYKAILVDREEYLLELSRYIVLNPVRAEMVRDAIDWPWSSHRAMLGCRADLKTLHTDAVLAAFGVGRQTAVREYRRFVSEGKNQPSPWKELKNQVYLGSESFVDKMLERIDRPDQLIEVPAAQRRLVAKPLAFYFETSSSRDSAIARAYASGGYSMKAIGDFCGLHYSRISRIIGKAKGKT